MIYSNTVASMASTPYPRLVQRIQSEKIMLVYFFSDLCPLCLQFRPKVENLHNTRFPRMAASYIDGEMYPEIAAKFKVFANPTVILFYEGKEYLRKSKYISIHEIGDEIERLYSMILKNKAA